MEAVGPVVLVPVAIAEAPCIRRSVGRKGYEINPPVILIQIPSNTLERFASTVTYERNGSTTTALAMMLGSGARMTSMTRMVVLMIKVIWPLLVMGIILVDTRGTSLITTNLPD